MSDDDQRVDLEWARQSRSAAFTVNETAQLLGVDPRTVTKGVRDGSLPSVQIGKRIVIPRLPLLRLLGAEPETNL